MLNPKIRMDDWVQIFDLEPKNALRPTDSFCRHAIHKVPAREAAVIHANFY